MLLLLSGGPILTAWRLAGGYEVQVPWREQLEKKMALLLP